MLKFNPELPNWEDVKVSVSVTDLVELLMASHDGINYELPNYPKIDKNKNETTSNYNIKTQKKTTCQT